jgi:RNA polymerase sigma-70 factor, ECF subfamily
MCSDGRARAMGAGEEPFPGVLRHVLRDLGFHMGAALLQEPPPDLLLVAVERGHVTRRLAAARERARGAPVIAVLRTSDRELASRALAAGAHAFVACDTSLEYLRKAALLLLGLNATGARPTTSPPRTGGLPTGKPCTGGLVALPEAPQRRDGGAPGSGSPVVTADPVEALRQVRFTEREREFVYAVALKYLKDADAAHEVAQDALLLAFRHRHSYLGKARFTTWLYRIAATSALMHLRRARRRRLTPCRSFDEELSLPEQCCGHPSPEELSSTGETLALCTRFVAELGPSYQPLFRMRFVEGRSVAEVAQKLGLSHNTVKTRAYRARKHVKQRLVQAGDERTLQ